MFLNRNIIDYLNYDNKNIMRQKTTKKKIYDEKNYDDGEKFYGR